MVWKIENRNSKSEIRKENNLTQRALRKSTEDTEKEREGKERKGKERDAIRENGVPRCVIARVCGVW